MKVLVVAPHVDDEIFSFGLLNRLGEVNLTVVYGTTQRDMGSRGIIISREETKVISNYFNQPKIRFLNLKDGYFDTQGIYAVSKRLEAIINEDKLAPYDYVLIPYNNDLNQDHRIIAEGCRIVFRSYSNNYCKVLMYETPSTTEQAQVPFNPNFFVELSPNIMNLKKKFYYEFKTGVVDYGPRSWEGIETLSKYRGLIINKEYAESFMILREIM
jgi:LmbE family N-acetylglucosaminyl deacetylase